MVAMRGAGKFGGNEKTELCGELIDNGEVLLLLACMKGDGEGRSRD